ncbi:polysaccharide deacetylase family protein [Actinomadura miaoliensis]|uniref:NodB homology domain-containing protein n=1 Tax=Actinomadura miaoliensis TaxID=430685 RepID=A0ABP7X3T4_9ACTN
MSWTRRRLTGLRHGAAATVLGAVFLAGCTAQPSRHVTAPEGSITTIRSTDPAAVPGMTTVTRLQRDERHRVFTGYPNVPGAPELTKALAAAVDEEVAPFDSATARTAPLPAGDVPELNVQWSLTAASGDVVGVRLVTSRFLGSTGGESRRTLWYDGATRTVHPSADLVNGPHGLAALAQRVREHVGSQANPARVRPDPRLFSSMGFNAEGDLVVEFSDYAIAPGTAGRVAVVLDGAEFGPLLSDFGRRARQAALAYRPKLALRRGASGGPSPTDLPSRAPNLGPQSATPLPPVDCHRAKCVALTFDDGPGPYTGRLLDTLAAHGARATFFVVGGNAVVHRDLLRRQVAEGHEIGNHTQNHRDLGRMPALQVNMDVQGTQQIVRGAVGRAPRLLRPPYGSTNSTVGRVAASLGLVQATWDVDVHDETTSDPRAIADRTVSSARPGAVILLHDTRRPTVEAVPRILNRLARKGYRFVTVSQLMSGLHVPPGGIFGGHANGR